jgi:hypothetical protein
MGKMKRIGESKIYTGKNGYTSTFTKVKVNNKTIWKRSGGSPKRTKKI